MISGSADERTLHLWNMSTYHCHKVIRRVGCCWINSIYQFDNDRWIVGGIDSFCILNINRCVIEKTIENEELKCIKCFLKFRDNKTILCGYSNGSFCFYDIKTEEYKITKNNHNEIPFINNIMCR